VHWWPWIPVKSGIILSPLMFNSQFNRPNRLSKWSTTKNACATGRFHWETDHFWGWSTFESYHPCSLRAFSFNPWCDAGKIDVPAVFWLKVQWMNGESTGDNVEIMVFPRKYGKYCKISLKRMKSVSKQVLG
jgi:hypothetical protein